MKKIKDVVIDVVTVVVWVFKESFLFAKDLVIDIVREFRK